ncbi:MAG: MotA/TolQ/ExbB proton channel family protein [Bdellovibrionales bacterium]|nr:MotA/TolQ/ExbB proton channel family protein [Bdellovibrionales bacterium]
MLLHLLPLIIVGAVSLAIILDRTWALYRKYPVNNHGFLMEVKQKILNNDIAGAIQFCSNQEGALSAKVMKAALLRAARDNRQIQAAVELTAHDAIASARKRVAYLAMLANVATLFGLLGTIMGLIQAFAAVANVDAATKSVMLAEGISTSMNATATGLLVAIPTMIAFSVLQSKANRITEEVEASAMTALDLLGARLYRDEWDENGLPKDRKPALQVVQGEKDQKAA